MTALRAYSAVTAIAILGCAIQRLVHGIPIPGIHDEFSYLLAAETFASGRLTNPPHAQWISLETFHQIHHPTYASMYPPGQGLFMAIGGQPWLGVSISVVLLCLAVLWAARAYLSEKWSFAAALFGIGMSLPTYWHTSYWGGAVAALGSALALGASKRQQPIPLALGILILANTRPFEGAIFTLCLLPFSYKLLLRKSSLALLTIGSAAMAYYNWRLTGNALQMPYVLNAREYLAHSLFRFQGPIPQPIYHHEVMRRLYFETLDFDLANWRKLIALQYWPTFRHFGAFFLPLPLLLALLHWRKWPTLWLTTAGVTVAVLSLTWVRPHYLAPAMPGLAILMAAGLSSIRTAHLANAFVLLWITIRILWGTLDPYNPWIMKHASDRQRLIETLNQKPGQHLILVRYDSAHNPSEEWVFNHADIDAAKIVWARESTPALNAEIVNYFQTRQIWLLEADQRRLTHYKD